MSEQNHKGKKRPKSYYIKCARRDPKTSSTGHLDSNMKGFLATCNGNEKRAVRELYYLLNEYADELYGPEQNNAATGKQESDEESENEDIEDAMKKEVNAMKDIKPIDRRFLRVNTRARNVLFIRTLLDDPCTLGHTILKDICQTGVQKARYAHKMIPISGTCRCNIEAIEKLGKSLFKKDFETPFGTGLSYTILFKKRNNTDITRDVVITKLVHIIHDLNPLHSKNHDTPDRVVIVEIIGNVFCLGVLQDYFKLQKYNLIMASERNNEKLSEESKTEQHELKVEEQDEDEKNDGGEKGDEKDESNQDKNEDDQNKEDDENGVHTFAENEERVNRKRKHSSSSETRHDGNTASLSRETTVIMEKIPHEDTVNMLSKNQTVIMQPLDKSETVVMESMPRVETVDMQSLDTGVSVMDALSKGESVMDMGSISKCESTMEVLSKGESVMDSF